MRTYPETGFDDNAELLSALGSFWAEVAQDRHVTTAWLRALRVRHRQHERNIDEIRTSVDRHTVPAWHVEKAIAVDVERQAPAAGRYGASEYGVGKVYGGADGTGFLVGIPGFVGCAAVTDSLSDPEHVWLPGVDVEVSPGRLDFLVPVTAERLWLLDARIDLEFVYRRVGYAVGVWGRSSPSYRDAVNALWDALSQGPTLAGLEAGCAAALGVPLAEDDEAVTGVYEDTGAVVVETRNRAYRSAGQLLPAVGDSLGKGQPVGGVTVIRQPRAEDLDWLPGLVLSVGELGPGYAGPLFFANDDVELEFVGWTDGKPEVRFDIRGRPEDVATFWRRCHQTGVAQGVVLSEYLASSPEMLPATVNPMSVLLELVSGGLTVVRLDLDARQPGGAGLGVLRGWRQALSPRHRLLVVLEAAAGVEDPGVSEDPQSEFGLAIEADTDVVQPVEHDPVWGWR